MRPARAGPAAAAARRRPPGRRRRNGNMALRTRTAPSCHANLAGVLISKSGASQAAPAAYLGRVPSLESLRRVDSVESLRSLHSEPASPAHGRWKGTAGNGWHTDIPSAFRAVIPIRINAPGCGRDSKLACHRHDSALRFLELARLEQLDRRAVGRWCKQWCGSRAGRAAGSVGAAVHGGRGLWMGPCLVRREGAPHPPQPFGQRHPCRASLPLSSALTPVVPGCALGIECGRISSC